MSAPRPPRPSATGSLAARKSQIITYRIPKKCQQTWGVEGGKGRERTCLALHWEDVWARLPLYNSGWLKPSIQEVLSNLSKSGSGGSVKLTRTRNLP